MRILLLILFAVFIAAEEGEVRNPVENYYWIKKLVENNEYIPVQSYFSERCHFAKVVYECFGKEAPHKLFIKLIKESDYTLTVACASIRRYRPLWEAYFKCDRCGKIPDNILDQLELDEDFLNNLREKEDPTEKEPVEGKSYFPKLIDATVVFYTMATVLSLGVIFILVLNLAGSPGDDEVKGKFVVVNPSKVAKKPVVTNKPRFIPNSMKNNGYQKTVTEDPLDEHLPTKIDSQITKKKMEDTMERPTPTIKHAPIEVSNGVDDEDDEDEDEEEEENETGKKRKRGRDDDPPTKKQKTD